MLFKEIESHDYSFFFLKYMRCSGLIFIGKGVVCARNYRLLMKDEVNWRNNYNYA